MKKCVEIIILKTFNQNMKHSINSEKEVKKAINKFLKNKKSLRNLTQMTKIFWKLNDEERLALITYHKMIEDNARLDIIIKLFKKLILVMHEEEFKEFEKYIRKEYGR